ncbi:superoxide dismutase family protein [Chitinimonas lacunae]|uniref:Superoxide dismutase [Cu-Zn] n=1 Tax=Chitinimonas lacunae TaxID=1963018 RepID=A0ABV8MNW7_9NEIS
MKKIIWAVWLCASAAIAADAPVKVELNPTVGNSARGALTLSETSDGVTVQGTLENLTPGQHGFHLHENAECAGNAEGAGGHYNPTGKPHGSPDADHHQGDLGNVMADNSGRAKVDAKVKGATLATLKGRAVIVHEKRDDLRSQPSGDAGGRVACGAIR